MQEVSYKNEDKARQIMHGKTMQENMVYNGDCMVLMQQWIAEGLKVDHVITDPPYDEKTHKNARTKTVWKINEKNDADVKKGIDSFDSINSEAEIARTLLDVSNRWVVCFCATMQMHRYKEGCIDREWVTEGVWHKPKSSPQLSGDQPGRSWESMCFMHNAKRTGKKRWNGGGRHAFYDFNVERNMKRHPTQKPLELMRQLVRDFTDPGELILDPFCGSGTTLVACVMEGRRYIGIEQNPEYYQISLDRLKEVSVGYVGFGLFADIK